MQRLIASLLLILPLTVTARADMVSDGQNVIESQIQAFLNDDMEGAYQYASPMIKRYFPSVEQFGRMVRSGYDPVYRPGNYAFGRTKPQGDGGFVQEVLIKGPNGVDWTALYAMEVQPDGTLKINGVQLLKMALPDA